MAQQNARKIPSIVVETPYRPGEFIGYVSTFPPQSGTYQSHVHSLTNLADQVIDNCLEEESFEEKRATLFQTAATLAHDINNILTLFINIDFVCQGLDVDRPELAHDLKRLRTASESLRELSNQLMQLAREGYRSVDTLVDTAAILRHNVEFSLLHSGILTEYALRDPWPIRVDPANFARVVQNLALNARQAMPHGGTLRVSTTNVVDPVGLPWLEIRFEDQGCGIAPEAIPYIFDMFFTTKADGTGVGLAYVKTFMKHCGGEACVSSVVDRGTTFTLRFPARVSRPPLACP